MSRRSLLMQSLLDSSSEDDDDELILTTTCIAHNQYQLLNASRHGDAMLGRQLIQRNTEAKHFRLYQDYFSDAPTYGPTIFRRRFRMTRSLFLRIVNAVESHDDYFVQKRDRFGRLGLSPLQKITASFQMLTYGVPTDVTNDYVWIGETITIESLKRFVKAIVKIFGEEYLRSPNDTDITRLLAIGEKRGFPGMLGSINCMHWRWKNCFPAWQSMYTSYVHEPTIILEAVASEDLWIWHSRFGLPGCHNDINVLHCSPFFTKLSEGHAPEVNYTINGHNYTMGYYLADNIYPTCATFVKTIPYPQENKRKYFAQAQQAVMKDVERAFGFLQARFAIVRGPARFWDQDTLRQIMTACVIMHNMIIEDERDESPKDFNYDGMGENVTVSHEHTPELFEFIQTHHSVKNKQPHSQLQDDLVEHLWQCYGEM